jgi:hypothetical protein
MVSAQAVVAAIPVETVPAQGLWVVIPVEMVAAQAVWAGIAVQAVPGHGISVTTARPPSGLRIAVVKLAIARDWL